MGEGGEGVRKRGRADEGGKEGGRKRKKRGGGRNVLALLGLIQDSIAV